LPCVLSLIGDTGNPTRACGVRWTIEGGIVYDSTELLADVRESVAAQKQAEATGGP
jgi:hypothetical protein